MNYSLLRPRTLNRQRVYFDKYPWRIVDGMGCGVDVVKESHAFLDNMDVELQGAGGTRAYGIETSYPGSLAIPNSAADNDNTIIFSPKPTVYLVKGRTVSFGVRFRTADVLQSDIAFGFGVASTLAGSSGSNYFMSADGTNLANGVVILKADGAATWTFNGIRATTKATVNLGVAASLNDVQEEWWLNWNGVDGLLHVYRNRQLVYTNPWQGATGNLPVVVMTPCIGIQNGEAVAKTLKLDLFRCVTVDQVPVYSA